MEYSEAFPTINYEPIKVTMCRKKKSKEDTRPFEAEVCKIGDDTMRFFLYKESARYLDRHHFKFDDCLIEYDGHKYFCTKADRLGYPKFPVLTAKLVA